MPLKKSIRMKKPAARASKPRARGRKATAAKWWTDTPVIAGAVTFVVAGAVMVAAYQSSTPGDLSAIKTRPVATVARTDVAATPVTFSDALDAAPAVSTAPVAPKPPATTITGCLQRSDDSFRLKDADGASTPKARSWKSGFLKKGTAPIAVIDPAKRLNLSGFVGQRVSVTGTLIDREMHVRSLQRVAASCSDPAKVRI
jgi:hypothetical protein